MDKKRALVLVLSLWVVLSIPEIGYSVSANDGFNPDANNNVLSIAVQADGKIIVGGGFTSIGGQARNYIARLSADDAALQNLTVSRNGRTITWMRGQSSPEVWRATFEHSPDGVTWASLGNGMRIAGGWELSGISLFFNQNHYVRARGYATGGYYNGSGSLFESVRIFYLKPIGPIVDFDGDGATDVAAFHLSSDQFFTDYTGNMGQYGWGGSNSYPLVWDYDGDEKTDVSIYHIPTNQWFVKGVPGDNLGQFGWGGDESIPVPGDYNGDGIMERAFYHWPTNRWFIEWPDHSVTSYDFGWNGAEYIPVPGDYDGNGTTVMMLYHIPSNQWFRYDQGNLGQYGWGGLQSFPIPGDYDGNGVMERAFYRPSENRWFIEGEADFVWGWDTSNFMPITGQMAIYNWFRFVLGMFQ